MLTEQITSRQNPLVKRAQRARDGAEPGRMFVEGIRLIEEALAADVAIEALIYTLALGETERGRALLEHAARRRCRGALVPEQILRAICDVETPQGAIALAATPRFELGDLFDAERPLVVALDALQDPGNVGTILRAAEASGASGVAATPGTAEPYGAKALRASMGSAFRLPVARRVRVAAFAEEARTRGVALYAAAADGKSLYTEVDWSQPCAVLVGNEGAGLSPEARSAADATISIPLAAPVESLNAALAAAVVLFEAARVRRG